MHPNLFPPHCSFCDWRLCSTCPFKNCNMFSHKVDFVTGKGWKKNEKKQERIRGRKWVPLFTSLSYTFQDDANAPGKTCIWSHVTTTWKPERSSPCACQIKSTQTPARTSQCVVGKSSEELESQRLKFKERNVFWRRLKNWTTTDNIWNNPEEKMLLQVFLFGIMAPFSFAGNCMIFFFQLKNHVF